MTKVPAPIASELYRPIWSFSLADKVYLSSETFRGSDPVVVARPDMFVLVGSSSEEVSKARSDRFGPVADLAPRDA